MRDMKTPSKASDQFQSKLDPALSFANPAQLRESTASTQLLNLEIDVYKFFCGEDTVSLV